MGKKADQIIDELSDGYHALGEVILEQGGSDVRYEIGYLDGWADARHHAGWAAEGKFWINKNAFPLLAARNVRRLVLKRLREARAKRL